MTKKIIITVTILISPIIFSLILYKVIKIDGFNSVSVVSSISTIQFFLWTLFILGLLLNLYLFKKFTKLNLLQNILILILILVLTSNLTSLALSLKGTSMPPYDIRGDLGKLVNLAKQAQLNGWVSVPSYPTLWVSIVGNLANLFDVHVLTIFRFAEYAFPIILAGILLIIWWLILPNEAALIVVIFNCIGFINWKNFSLFILIPILLFVFKDILEANKKLNNKTIIKDYLFGFLIGFLILWYFGNFWWIILNLTIFILISWFSKNKNYYFSRQIRIYTGFSLIFLTEYYQLYNKLQVLFLVLFSLMLIIFIEICERNNYISALRNYLFGVLTPIVLSYVFFSKKIGDIWFERIGENPSTNFLGDIQDVQSLFYILIIILLSLFGFQNNWFRLNFYFLFGILISSSIEMHYLASRMYELNQVNLWPRAKEIQDYSFKLLILLLIISFFYTIFQIFQQIDVTSELFKKYRIDLITIGTFISFLAISYSLSVNTFNSMPLNTFNGAWYAHQACSNPHVDPMLAKTFEEQPDVEKYLREKCWGKDWPLINKK